MNTSDAMTATPADSEAFVERLFTQTVSAMDTHPVEVLLFYRPDA